MATVLAPLPRVTIQFCTQCKWMLRAAYFAQELLSTFGTALGEVALQPSTGGTFIVSLYSPLTPNISEDGNHIQHLVLWDRKVEGGFPETKELKKRVRDVIEPGRDLGHVDGKRKSISAINVDIAGHGRQEQLTANGEVLSSETQGQEVMKTTGEQSLLPEKGVVTEVKRNLDGSICEDCD